MSEIEIGNKVSWVKLAKPGGKAGWQKVGIVKNIVSQLTNTKEAVVSCKDGNYVVPLKELSLMPVKTVTAQINVADEARITEVLEKAEAWARTYGP